MAKKTISKITSFIFNHIDQVRDYGKVASDYTEIQSNFDSRAEANQEDRNNLIDVLQSETVNDAGANAIGTEGTFGTNNVGDEIKAIKVVTDSKAPLSDTYTKSEVDGKDTILQNQITSNDGDILNLQSGKADKADTYTETEVDTLLDAKADKTNVLELDNTDAFTPTADYHPATKKFVDDTAFDGVGDNSITDIKMATDYKLGGLSNLNTTEKSSYTGAINEVVGNVSDLETVNTDKLFLSVRGGRYNG